MLEATARTGRTPEECCFRTIIDQGAAEAAMVCALAARILGVQDKGICAVRRDACEACCRSLAPAEAVNPVVASLVFEVAGQVERAGGVPGCTVRQARLARQGAANHLALVPARLPDRCFPPQEAHRNGVAHNASVEQKQPGTRLRWQVGLLTAPRDAPTIHQTLSSLHAAGFTPVHVFAEPGSWIPQTAGDLRVAIHERRLGNLTNFYNALATLLEQAPDADAFAIFQDDVRVAEGTRAWCEAEFWPGGGGLVSLFTPRPHARPQTGWHLLLPGANRICGAQAIVFRRDVLRSFLADPLVVRSLHTSRSHDDAIVGGWTARQRLSIAYHTPSLVRHTGVVSSLFPEGPDPRNFADAVENVAQIPTWRAPPTHRGKVGLIGWQTASGLGYLNHYLAKHLDVDRWLVPVHPDKPAIRAGKPTCPIEYTSIHADTDSLRRWLNGLDWVLFAEQPYCPRLARAARVFGVNIACIPNWECLNPKLAWLACVDLMICPSLHTYRHACDWKHRYCFGWDVIYVPCPMDTGAFRFRQRTRCRRYVFINGWGGGRPRRLDGSPAPYGRKGGELIAEAARAAPDLSFIVHSQVELNGLPPNVELRKPPSDHRRLYHDGDVCVQPSHYEGIGLQLLECQAAGMPLITSDAPPMNEYQPLDVIPVRGWDIVELWGDQPLAAQMMSVGDLVDVLRRWHQADIGQASLKAREFIEREHSWTNFRQTVDSKLVAYPRA
ncbi:MAG TPA: glycosyltransferase [Pirellulales bacterium]|nr:glycosyltransferase [Pirellulales bacterium]